MSPEENKARVLAFVDAFYHRGDLSAIERFAAPDLIDHTPMRGEKGDRRSFIAGTLALRHLLAEAIPDFHIAVPVMLAEDDLVALRVTVEGKRTGSLFGLPASSGPLPITAMVLVRMRDGRAIELWQEQNIILAEDAAMLQERQRLARDLHDSVTQSLFSLNLLARAAQEQQAQNTPRLGQTLDRVATLAQQALVEMRALLLELRADTIAEEGLVGALEKLVAALRTRTDLDITLDVPAAVALPATLTEATFRIVQEALSNAAKHAQASRASVIVTADAGLLQVTVQDNGRGFDMAATPAEREMGAGGMGLRFMRERANSAGLMLELSSSPGYGTTVRIEAPLG
jgi:signal transduction histidine kinase